MTISIWNKLNFYILLSQKNWVSTTRHCQAVVNYFVNCSIPVEPGLTGFEQLINFVSSSWFAAKSAEQMIVEQSNFEQFTPTLCNCQNWFKYYSIFKAIQNLFYNRLIHFLIFDNKYNRIFTFSWVFFLFVIETN